MVDVLPALIGALGLISAVVSFVIGRQSGRKVEIGEQRRAKATADEIIAQAERNRLGAEKRMGRRGRRSFSILRT